MSRSNHEKLVNPSQQFISWKSGGFQWWDKDNKVNVEIKLPVKFLVLDSLSTIKGFSDKLQSGFWSNEIRDTKKEILTVRNKSGVAAKGLYEEVKTNADCIGIKYCQSVYIGLVEGNTLTLANLQLTGAALSSWIEFVKDNDIYDGSVEVLSSVDAKKGATKYTIPTFTKGKSTDVLNKEADALDVTLQAYLTTYFERSETDTDTAE